MINTDSLPWLGVKNFGMVQAGQIIGLLEAQKEQEQMVKEKVSRYSFGISIDIAEMFLKKVRVPPLHEYLSDDNHLIKWIVGAMEWADCGVSFNTPTLIEIPRSDFELTKMESKDAFIEYLNKAWYKYAKLNDLPDSQNSIKFFFQLTT